MAYSLVVLTPPTESDGACSIGYLADFHLDRAAFDRLITADRVVRRLMEGGLRAYANETRHQYEVFIQQVQQAVIHYGEADAHAFHRSRWNLTGCCAVLSFASAVHLFREQTEATAERYGGPKSRQEVKDLFRASYDQSPEHYLLYRLRNMMVHYSMDCAYLAVLGERGDPTTALPQMRLDRDLILRIPKGVGGALRSYLSSFSADPVLSDAFDDDRGVLRRHRS